MNIGCYTSYSRAEIYNELNKKIEHFTKWAYINIVYFGTAGSMIPPILLSFMNYYIYDLKDESFELVTPIMYVKMISFLLNKNIF